MDIRELFKGKVFTFSNFLSSLRIIIVPFIGYMLFLENKYNLEIYRYYAILILVFVVMTDFLDGFVARAFNQVSKLGQFLDPIADKIATNSLGLLLYYYRDLPLWVVILCLLRDLHGFLGAAFLYKLRDVQVRPNLPGKILVVIMAITAFVYILNPTINIFGMNLHWWSIASIVFFITFSTTLYWRTYSKVYFEQMS